MPLGPISRLVLLEASKVRGYHSTLVDGLIRAHVCAGRHPEAPRPVLYCHRSFYEHLSADARAAVAYRPIPVVDQEKRWLVRKSLLEALVVFRCMMALRKDDVLLITTIMPSAMLLVELAKHLFPRRRVVAMQHGELEGALGGRSLGPGSFGFYVALWMKVRSVAAAVDLAVLDDFIAKDLLRRFPKAVHPAHLFVVPLPMSAVCERTVRQPGPPRCCFIGYDTPNKGYDIFVRLSRLAPEFEFHVIGAGADRNLRTGEQTRISSSEAFLEALSQCDIAIFPYVAGYTCSLSAAATDAISAGLHLLATDRPCFQALAEAFGPGTVTICPDEAALLRSLQDHCWIDAQMGGRPQRIGQIQRSHYGFPSVAAALEQITSRARNPASSRGAGL